MPSTKRVEPLDTFEIDVPITPEDVAALARAREESYRMDADEYLQFLLAVTRNLPPSREPDGPWPEPFEL